MIHVLATCPAGCCCLELRNEYSYMIHVDVADQIKLICCRDLPYWLLLSLVNRYELVYRIHVLGTCPTGCCCHEPINKYIYMIHVVGNCPTGCCCL